MAGIPEKGIINTKQIHWMLFIVITSFTTLHVPGLLVFQSGRDAWLSILAVLLLDSLLPVVYVYLAIRFPGENPVQYSISILGKIWGRIFGLFFIIFFLIVSVVLMRGLGLYIGDVFLPMTPPEIVLLSAYLTIAYIVRKGIEVIARICEVLGPIYLLGFIGLFLLVLPFVHIERLMPQFDQGVYPFLSGIPLIMSYIAICMALGWYIAVCNRPENGYLAKITSLSLGTLMVCLVIVFSIGSFGIEQAGNFINPGLQLARLIHVSDYLERMETVWMLIVIGAGIMTAVSSIWIFSLSLAQLTGLDSYKKLVYPAAFLSLVLALTSFPNNTSYLNFAFYIFPVIGPFIQAGLVLFLFAAALVLGKKGRAAPELK